MLDNYSKMESDVHVSFWAIVSLLTQKRWNDLGIFLIPETTVWLQRFEPTAGKT